MIIRGYGVPAELAQNKCMDVTQFLNQRCVCKWEETMAVAFFWSNMKLKRELCRDRIFVDGSKEKLDLFGVPEAYSAEEIVAAPWIPTRAR